MMIIGTMCAVGMDEHSIRGFAIRVDWLDNQTNNTEMMVGKTEGWEMLKRIN